MNDLNVIPITPIHQAPQIEEERNALIVVGNTVEYISNCIGCPNHTVVKDPDKYDWFCDDDIAVLCGITPNDMTDPHKAWKSGEIWPNKAITTSCRPFEFVKRKECKIPEWCPILVKE